MAIVEYNVIRIEGFEFYTDARLRAWRRRRLAVALSAALRRVDPKGREDARTP